ncbi:killer cell lectin-like receptor subfamily B member 1C [Oxyura jamaicensis]|uniref:killer cell lectin-like receptor subfamily B member 1C n=1 Tax=Oxyura jamaicensis TaxID=8884 RepID=UPI0015A64E7D|nr:killer cell lectin-like receptor subfamily B member 1C [Oxyura jamaicensis]
MEEYVSPSLLRYVCCWNGSAGHGGCKLCPQYWQLSGDHCYQVSKSTGTWSQGKEDCERRGSYLAVLRNKADMERLNEGIQQEYKEKLTVWIGLKASKNTWKWVDNSYKAAAFSLSPLESVENGCATFKDKRLEVDGCESDHNWVCQKAPFPLISKTAGELCGARPKKSSP